MRIILKLQAKKVDMQVMIMELKGPKQNHRDGSLSDENDWNEGLENFCLDGDDWCWRGFRNVRRHDCAHISDGEDGNAQYVGIVRERLGLLGWRADIRYGGCTEGRCVPRGNDRGESDRNDIGSLLRVDQYQ
jgi:hypothetical protein